MKATDNGRPSLVEFLGSIKFSRQRAGGSETETGHGHFARLQQSTRRAQRSEEAQLIRSAN
jgi:hypothetical protein